MYVCMYVCEVRSERVGNKKIFFVDRKASCRERVLMPV